MEIPQMCTHDLFIEADKQMHMDNGEIVGVKPFYTLQHIRKHVSQGNAT